MAIVKNDINNFIASSSALIIDVRSPGEYCHAHIPGAINIPIFDNEERKHIGITYKQESRELAIKIGLSYFGKKMRAIVEEVEDIIAKLPGFDKATNTIHVHCWRGGMRSQAIAWLLDLYGFNIGLISDGYKAYRKWALHQFEKEYTLNVLGGYTGSGKTIALTQLQQTGKKIIDLERIARHKGSAFGALDGHTQPSQEMFENLLAWQLNDLSATGTPIWIEDESQRIGAINIPAPFWKTMRQANLFFLEIPFEERLDNITAEYGKYTKEKLINAIIRMQKRLGGLETKTAISFLVEDNMKECFKVLLQYYDKQYKKALANRTNAYTIIEVPSKNSISEILSHL